ncbi:ScyD/ScyE family protein [Nostoc commune]|uniref:ScyD/ScyE family protein n=1 Tax=Nostoc commune TaxID=1178 RepID=UPI0018C798A5|nr:ScyD/ScyE family protein [Nostoc commune]MBG1260707.1 ScyD/ScyE family protein [Nostoc commune BAE]
MNFELLFDENYYLAKNPDVAASVKAGYFSSGLEHFKEVGQFEGRDPSGFFDTDAYLTLNLDVAVAVQKGEVTPYGHFIKFGQFEGRDPNALFDTRYYLEQNPGVAAAIERNGITAIEHFVKFGQFEGRDPSALFDTKYYLEQNPDVAAAVEKNKITAIEHFVNIGRLEGRDPSATFDETFAPKFPSPSTIANSEYNVTLVASGLDNPRDLAFSPNGDLYVVEAGRGGDGPSIRAPEIGLELSYGTTGAVTRIRDGVQNRVITDLPSLARRGSGIGAYGPHAIGFNENGDAYLVTGFTSSPDVRAKLGSLGSDLGQLVKLNFTDNSWQTIADLVQYEGLNNPDGQDVVSNPYAVLVQENSLLVLDAGANDLVRVDNAGNISLEAVFKSRVFGNVPTDFVPPVAIEIGPDGAILQSVPTSIVIGPDGAYYVSELTGYPLPENGARVYRIEPGKEPKIYADGFTQIIDLAFDPEGNMYVLEYASNSLALISGGNPTGTLVQVSSDGSRKTLISSGLINPAGVAIGSDDSIYISNYGSFAGEGQVLRFERKNQNSSLKQEKLIFGSQEDDAGIEKAIEVDLHSKTVIAFGGDGNDEMDATTNSAAKDRLYGGTGGDELFAGTNDRLIGGSGNDTLDASVGNGGNRLYAGDGDDLLLAGASDRLFGQAGDDILFAGNGNSVLTGGQGTDQFWIANAAFPSSPNTITDFEVGIDVVGIGGINGVDKFEDLNITYDNNGVTISAVGQEIAILQGLKLINLDSSNFFIAQVTEAAALF